MKMSYFALVKKGYGDLNYLYSLDTNELYEILEYENMMSDIESLIMEDSQRQQ